MSNANRLIQHLNWGHHHTTTTHTHTLYIYIYIYIYIYLPSCGHVGVSVKMHSKNSNETDWEKAREEPYQNVTCCLQQILEAVHHETAAVTLLAFHLTNSWKTTSKKCWVRKVNFISDILLWISTHEHINSDRGLTFFSSTQTLNGSARSDAQLRQTTWKN